MFGVGTTEIAIILLIALLVLGPKEIPKIARTLGRGLREIERAKDELKESIEFDIEEDNKKEVKEPESAQPKDTNHTKYEDNLDELTK